MGFFLFWESRRSTLLFRTSLAHVFADHLFPLPLRLKDKLHGIASGAVAAPVRGHVMSIGLYFVSRVSNGNGQAAILHGRKVDDVVSDKCRLTGADALTLQDFFKGGQLVLNSLADVLDFKIAGAKCHCLRDALGDEPGLDAGEAGQRNCGAIVGMKPFDLDHGRTGNPESAFAAMLGSMLLRTELKSGRSGNKEQFAVGQDAVNVEEYEFDFFGANFGGLRFGHPGDSSIAQEPLAAEDALMLVTELVYG
jgi:hypothetical protein